MPIAEIAGWFATYVYLPKLRDRVVLERAVADALAKLDPKFAYAGGYDAASNRYIDLVWQKAPIGPMPNTALLVRPEAALAQLRPAIPVPVEPQPRSPDGGGAGPMSPPAAAPVANRQPTRFFGSVEIDVVRPVKAFETIVNAVVAELQRTKGVKVTLTLEIEAASAEGFSEADVGVVRDNAGQLKFKAESTGFE